MDPSSNTTMNGAQLHQDANGHSYNFLDGLPPYAGHDALTSGNEDFHTFFDPALFENAPSLGHGYSQQSQPLPQTFNQNATRQSNSPGIPQYNASQPSFSHNQYSQPLYESRSISQTTFDPRFYPRPSPSPVAFDSYHYQPPMNLHNQNFNSPPLTMQQRQTSTPTQPYPPRQQQPSPYMNIGPRPSHLSQIQNAEMMHFPAFPEQNHQPSSTYVDPSILTANQMMSTSNNGTFLPHQPYGTQYFSKPGSTVDPRSLQGMSTPQPIAAAPPPSQAPQVPHTGILVPPPSEKPERVAKVKALKDPNAPKKARSKTAQDAAAGTKREGQASASDSDSDGDLSIEGDEPPEETPFLLTVSAPTDERGKALFNAVQAVWTPRNRPASPDKIRSGIAAFGETVRALRDAWKAKNDSLKKAELPTSPTAAEVPRLKDDVAHYRQVMESVMARSLFFGHPSVVSRLGENQFTMSALYSFLLDRFTAGDYDSSLVSSILKFVVMFNTVDEEMLEMTKWAKILQRFAKKATNESKNLAQAIINNAAAATSKKKASDVKLDSPASPPSVNGASDGARKDAVAGVKRTREGDPVSLPVPKKLVKPVQQSSKPLALQNAERRKALEAAQAAKAEKEKPAASAVSANTAKPKVAVAPPPKSALFSALTSASKKPGTSNAARAAAAAAAKEKASVSTTGSTTGSTKDGVKKDSPPRSLGPAAPAKTPSSFLGLLADMEKKPEVEPKKEEEIVNETDEQRAKRLRKEARRKLRVSWKADADLVETRLFTHDPDEETGHADSMMRDAGDTVREGEMLKLHKGLEDLEDDEDEDSFEDLLTTYTAPSEVDLSHMADDVAVNAIKFGGPVKPESPSSEAQAKHERDTVMVVYASKSDRPSTPKEPDDGAEEGDFQPVVDFGEPDVKTRAREKEYLTRQPRPASTPGTDLTTQIPPMTATPPSLQPPTFDLQRTLSMLTQQSQPAAPPPPGATGGLDLQKLLATVQQVGQQWQSQQQYQAPPQAPNLSTNLSALLSQIQQPNHSQGLPLGLAGNPNPFPGAADDHSRKHSRNDSNNDYDGDYSRRSTNKKKKGGDKSKPYNYKTLACSFWKEGKCAKGDDCTYRHDDA